MAESIDITIPSLSGKRALVTGGTDGIGLIIASRLAAAGAHLVLPARNPEKSEAAVARIRRDTPWAVIEQSTLDLSSLQSVASLSKRLVDEGTPIHILVNNAGVMTPPERQTTADGLELQFGTNFVGHYALIAGLFPLLRAGEARVVSQLSIAAATGSINWDDLNWERSYSGQKAYSQSKIAFGLFARELARRSASQQWGLRSMLVHPGVAPTSLLAARPELGRSKDTIQVRMIRTLSARGLLLGTVETAALPALYAATAPEVQSGQFYGPRGIGHLGGGPAPQRLYRPLRSDEDANRIWTTTERLTGLTIGEQ